MIRHIFKCNNCNKHTMKETCDCGNKTLFSRPIKYTPNDKFSSYRRKAKISLYASRGLL